MNKIRPLVFIALVAAALPAAAAEWKAFDESQFRKDKAAGKTVVLDFYADWCPVCQKQKAALGGVIKDKSLKDVVGYTVDYDNSDALQKQLKVRSQSTLIVYKGSSEKGRAAGVTDPDKLKKLIQKGL